MALTEMSKTMQKCDSSFQSLNISIAKLQSDLQLLSKPVTAAPAPSTTLQLNLPTSYCPLKDVSDKIDKLCANELEIAAASDHSDQPMNLSPSSPSTQTSNSIEAEHGQTCIGI